MNSSELYDRLLEVMSNTPSTSRQHVIYGSADVLNSFNEAMQNYVTREYDYITRSMPATESTSGGFTASTLDMRTYPLRPSEVFTTGNATTHEGIVWEDNGIHKVDGGEVYLTWRELNFHKDLKQLKVGR